MFKYVHNNLSFMKKIGDGAEAVVYLGKDVVKDRISKSYRHKNIDIKLRKFRTRREGKILEKLGGIKFPCPKVIGVDDKEMKLKMEYIKAPMMKDVLEKKDYKKICKEVGKYVAIMHNAHIIHGDLTTSNMLLKRGHVFFIDFGLSFISYRGEDMAVDIHLLKQALESKHYSICDECFKSFLKGYKKVGDYKEIMKRLEKVELRGRYKHK